MLQVVRHVSQAHWFLCEHFRRTLVSTCLTASARCASAGNFIVDVTRSPDALWLQVLVTLVQMGDLDLAKQCMAALIKSGFPWVAATAKVEMVRQGHVQVGNFSIEFERL